MINFKVHAAHSRKASTKTIYQKPSPQPVTCFFTIFCAVAIYTAYITSTDSLKNVDPGKSFRFSLDYLVLFNSECVAFAAGVSERLPVAHAGCDNIL